MTTTLTSSQSHRTQQTKSSVDSQAPYEYHVGVINVSADVAIDTKHTIELLQNRYARLRVTIFDPDEITQPMLQACHMVYVVLADAHAYTAFAEDTSWCDGATAVCVVLPSHVYAAIPSLTTGLPNTVTFYPVDVMPFDGLSSEPVADSLAAFARLHCQGVFDAVAQPGFVNIDLHDVWLCHRSGKVGYLHVFELAELSEFKVMLKKHVDQHPAKGLSVKSAMLLMNYEECFKLSDFMMISEALNDNLALDESHMFYGTTAHDGSTPQTLKLFMTYA